MASLIDVYEISKVDAADKKSKVAVIIPCYNEQDTIEATLKKVSAEGIPWQNIYVVDDCSTDKTGSIIERYWKEINCLYHHKNRGKEAAVKKGLKAALRNKNLETIIFLDANQLSIKHALKLAFLVQHGYDWAFGERNKEHMPFTRRAANGWAKLSWTLLYPHYEYSAIFQDPLCGYCAVSRNAAEKIVPKLDRKGRFLLEPHLKYLALLNARATKKPIAIVRNLSCPYEAKSAMKLQNLIENAIFGDIAIPIISKLDEISHVFATTAYKVFYKGCHKVYNYIGFPAIKVADKICSKVKKLKKWAQPESNR